MKKVYISWLAAILVSCGSGQLNKLKAQVVIPEISETNLEKPPAVVQIRSPKVKKRSPEAIKKINENCMSLLLTQPSSEKKNRMLTCKRINRGTKEWRVKFQKIEEKKRLPPCYNLKTTGISPLESYELYQVSIYYMPVSLGFCHANDKGKLMFDLINQTLDNWNVCAGGFMKGEPAFYVLLSDDETICLATYIVPYPIEFVWDDSAIISMIMAVPKGEVYTIKGSGFKSNEKLKLHFEQEGKISEIEAIAEKDGTCLLQIENKLDNEKGGIGILTIFRDAHEQKASLNYFWGQEAEKAMVNI